jgi:hypothetical protein
MLALIRKWSIDLRRRRLRKERETLQHYKIVEEDAKGHAQRCHNCRAPLTGPYCHICGQRDDDLRRPIWTFFRELLDALFDTDSKIIKTILMLMLVPGGLSRGFNMGRRARFLPPLRLYVVLSFAFFITLSLTNVLILDIKVTPTDRVVEEREIAEAAAEEQRELAEQMQELQQELHDDLREQAEELKELGVDPSFLGEIPNLPPLPDAVEPVEEVEEGAKARNFELQGLLGQLSGAAGSGEEEAMQAARDKIEAVLSDPNKKLSEQERRALEKVMEVDFGAIGKAARQGRGDSNSGFNLPYDFDIAMFVKNDNTERDGIEQRDLDHIMNDEDTPEWVKTATVNFTDALKDPKEFNDLFNDALPWAMVILVPVFALILKVFHWGKRRYYLNQLVFALHFHSFLFVLLTSFAFIVPVVGGEDALMAFWLITSVYLVIALKVGQEQSWIRAFLKAGFVYFIYFFVMVNTIGSVLAMNLGDIGIAEVINGEGLEITQD